MYYLGLVVRLFSRQQAYAVLVRFNDSLLLCLVDIVGVLLLHFRQLLFKLGAFHLADFFLLTKLVNSRQLGACKRKLQIRRRLTGASS